jgi:phosphatidylserine/phosphatidylglycerophosphate/cardiolipin synthase-like enzyme
LIGATNFCVATNEGFEQFVAFAEDLPMPRNLSNAPAASAAGKAKAHAYASPGVVLLAMDWPAGAKFADFLGFAILRAPGFRPNQKAGYLLNKIGFTAPKKNSRFLPSNLAPFQKFLWWDGAINDGDRGKTFRYTVTPTRGTGPWDLKLHREAEVTISVTVPKNAEDGISTWFNRAVVSSQSFSRQFPHPEKTIDKAMAWLANGLQQGFPDILSGNGPIAGAIYHLTDKEWVLPVMKKFKGNFSLVYQDRKNDRTSVPAIQLLKSSKFKGAPRSKTNIMHDKFLADTKGGRVLMGSVNFTPEGLTSQANLMHIFDSPRLTKLYAQRQKLLTQDPTVANTARHAGWSKTIKVGKAGVRVFFSPERKGRRVSIDTVVSAVKNAKKSVMFCMFSPTDPALIKALLATSDRKKLLFGLLNSISDPSKKEKSDTLARSGEAPRGLSESAKVQVTLFNRSRRDKKVLAYSYFRPGKTPASFLPELSAVDFSSRSTLPASQGGAGKGPPAVHIHHKFIIIDAETDGPTIFTGSANLSANSTSHNDENLLEIKGSTALAQTYLAEFLRLYEHYRARALWNLAHPRGKTREKLSPAVAKEMAAAFTLKRTRDAWVKGAYKPGTPEYRARIQLASAE